MTREIDRLLKAVIEKGFNEKLKHDLLTELNTIVNTISRRDYLAIKHGNISAAQRVYRQLNNCSCNSVYRETTLETQNDYISCSDAVDLAEKSGLLSPRRQPSWSDQAGFELNPSRFLECNQCGLVWQLSKPERNHAGVWRLA